jgi:hypothetical protein
MDRGYHLLKSRGVEAVNERSPALAEGKVDIHARKCLDVHSLIKTADVHPLKADVADQPGDRLLRALVVAAEDKIRRRF